MKTQRKNDILKTEFTHERQQIAQYQASLKARGQEIATYVQNLGLEKLAQEVTIAKLQSEAAKEKLDLETLQRDLAAQKEEVRRAIHELLPKDALLKNKDALTAEFNDRQFASLQRFTMEEQQAQ